MSVLRRIGCVASGRSSGYGDAEQTFNAVLGHSMDDGGVGTPGVQSSMGAGYVGEVKLGMYLGTYMHSVVYRVLGCICACGVSLWNSCWDRCANRRP